MTNVCPLCKHRVSEWMMASGKTEEVGNEIVHKSCAIDYKLRMGVEYRDLHARWQRLKNNDHEDDMA